MATISGPRVDVSDTRTLEYWDCTTGAQCGQLKKVTNALGHVTTFDQYDGAGRLLKTTSPNGVATTFVYNKAGNVTTVTETPPAGGGSASWGWACWAGASTGCRSRWSSNCVPWWRRGGRPRRGRRGRASAARGSA